MSLDEIVHRKVKALGENTRIGSCEHTHVGCCKHRLLCGPCNVETGRVMAVEVQPDDVEAVEYDDEEIKASSPQAPYVRRRP